MTASPIDQMVLPNCPHCTENYTASTTAKTIRQLP